MAEDLKPCPFCGGEAEIVEVMDNPPETIAIQCKSGCGVSAHHKWMDESVLIKRWNTRAERTTRLIWNKHDDCFECESCGKGMKPEWAYCPRCGAKVA